MSPIWIDRAGRGAQLLGGALVAALGVRVMTLAIGEAQARRLPAPEPAVIAPPAAAPARAEPVRAPLGPPPKTVPKGAPLRLMLSVLAGPERSEVFVNGSRLGLTPYLGDLSCKQGEPLRIEVVPAQQGLISRSAICEGRTLFIR
jgi:hypothetical protein